MKEQQQLLTRAGNRFPFDSLAKALLARREVKLPKEACTLTKIRGVCIDDGITTDELYEQLVPFSGVGLGESLEVAKKILDGVEKIKPHRGCGKAALTLAARRKRLGIEAPTPEEIDRYAEHGAQYLGDVLKIDVGRMLDFDDGRHTRLDRPEDHHLAQGAVIGLSGRFPHNVLPSEQDIPSQYRLAGTYYDPEDLQLVNAAANEALLALQIASGAHGVKIVKSGFRYTALVDVDDSQKNKRMDGLKSMWSLLQEKREKEAENSSLNAIALDIVGYRIKPTPGGCTASFELINLR